MTRHHYALLCCLLLCLTAAPLRAADTPTPAPPAPAGGAREYTIQVGDVLGITVLGEATYSGAFPVRADGTLLFNDDMVGAVAVANLTAEQATEVITKRVGEFVKSPTVSLAINRFKVMVVGEVQQPGQYDLDSGARLMDAVTRAGGAKDELRDLGQVTVIKISGAHVQFNLRAFREQADESQNPMLLPGDRVYVGPGSAGYGSEYTVTGAVKKPGAYPLDPRHPIRISEAVEAAERWTEDGDPRAAQLVHKDGSQVAVDLTQFDQDATNPKNVTLQDGDDLFIPRNTAEVGVVGGVKKPGVYHVPAGTSLLEAIAMAGGPDDTAILRNCAVLRNQPKPMRIPANLDRLAKDGDMTQNPVLKDRDVVFVPFVARNGAPKKSAFDIVSSVAGTAIEYMWMLHAW